MSDVKHGVVWTYTNGGCRCVECRAANTAYQRGVRAARAAKRVQVDGRLVADVAPERHGKGHTYRCYGCRCEPCTRAQTQDTRTRRRRVRQWPAS